MTARPATALKELTWRDSEEVSLGRLIGNVLVEHGIADLFCIPGDFTMQLTRELLHAEGLTLRTMSHEYGTTLAAIGYAVGKHAPSAVCFTYGVGILNATNGIAQAYVERVPLVVLSGAPSKREVEADIFVHHQISDHGVQRRILSEITVHQAIISDAHTALDQVREAIAIARAQLRPVYIEIPRDLYLTKVRYVPRPKLSLAEQAHFAAPAWSAAAAAIELLRRARNAVLVPGLEVKRFQLADQVKSIVELLGLPWVASPMSQGALAADHPHYRGMFAGPASPLLSTRTLVEQCDLLFVIGEPNSDVNMGLAGNMPTGRLVHCHDGVVKVGRKSFAATTAEFVGALVEVARTTQGPLPDFLERAPVSAPIATELESASAALTPFAIIEVLNQQFAQDPGSMLIADCGDSFFMALGMTPADVLSSSLYMSMGIAVPGAIGYQLATGKRPIVLVGDGAFHMTGNELMHAKRFGVAPIVIVLNNRKWTSLSPDETDQDLTRQENLEFARLAHFLKIKSFTATTSGGFAQALGEAVALDEAVLIDAQIDPTQRSYLCERFFSAIKAQHHLPKP